MLLAIDLHEDFVDEEGIAEASVPAFQASSINGPELDTPEADRFPANSYASFSEQVFNVTVADIESEVEPDCLADDVGWEAVAFVGIHSLILAMIAI